MVSISSIRVCIYFYVLKTDNKANKPKKMQMKRIKNIVASGLEELKIGSRIEKM